MAMQRSIAGRALFILLERTMSNERIEQCKADIAKLQDELKRLEDDEAEPKPRHGDIVRTSCGMVRVVIFDEWPKAYDGDGMVQSGVHKRDAVALDYAAGAYTRIGNVFDIAEEL